jgi:hypothetical protein
MAEHIAGQLVWASIDRLESQPARVLVAPRGMTFTHAG